MDAGRSLMYIENKSGPKTEPCRTPEPIGEIGRDCTINSNCLKSVGKIALYLLTQMVALMELNFRKK